MTTGKMDVIAAYCNKCKGELGRFRNSWNGIGNTYHSPVDDPISLKGIENTGASYGAARESSIKDSSLQDVACKKCQAVVGLRCEDAPDGHLLKKDQMILRLTEMTIIAEGSGQPAKISVQKIIPLTHTKVGGRRRASTVQPSPLSQVITVRAESENLTSPQSSPLSLEVSNPKGAQVERSTFQSVALENPASDSSLWVPPATAYLPDTGRFKTWAENVISAQRLDINRISKAVMGVENDMQTFKVFMQETKAELSSIRDREVKRIADIAYIRDEQTSLRKAAGASGSFITRLETLSTSASQVRLKAIEIDGLKAEMEKMKACLKALEKGKTALEPIRAQPAPSKRSEVPKPLSTSPMRSTETVSSTKRRRDTGFCTNALVEEPTTKIQKLSDDVRTSRSQSDHSVTNELLSPSPEAEELLSPTPEPDLGADDATDDNYKPVSRLPEGMINMIIPRETRTPRKAQTDNPQDDRCVDPEGAAAILVPTARGRKVLPGKATTGVSVAPVIIPMSPRKHSLKVGGTRDANGVLLTATGKVDKRSLRYAKLREEAAAKDKAAGLTLATSSPTPAPAFRTGISQKLHMADNAKLPKKVPIAEAQARWDALQPATPHGTHTPASAPFEDIPALPSAPSQGEETQLSKIASDKASSSSSGTSSKRPPLEVPKVIRASLNKSVCGKCSKTLSEQKFCIHKCVPMPVSSARKEELANLEVEDDAAKEKLLRDREQLVHQTLEMEMEKEA